MIICRNGTELHNLLLRDITKQIDIEITPSLKDILESYVDSEIYDAYTPKYKGWGYAEGGKWIRATYARRNDIGNKLTSIVDSTRGEVTVTTLEKPNTSRYGGDWINAFNQIHGSFFLLLERTAPGLWHGGFSRPVIPLAQEEVNNSPDIRSSIQSLLNSMSCV